MLLSIFFSILTTYSLLETMREREREIEREGPVSVCVYVCVSEREREYSLIESPFRSNLVLISLLKSFLSVLLFLKMLRERETERERREREREREMGNRSKVQVSCEF